MATETNGLSHLAVYSLFLELLTARMETCAALGMKHIKFDEHDEGFNINGVESFEALNSSTLRLHTSDGSSFLVSVTRETPT